MRNLIVRVTSITHCQALHFVHSKYCHKMIYFELTISDALNLIAKIKINNALTVRSQTTAYTWYSINLELKTFVSSICGCP